MVGRQISPKTGGQASLCKRLQVIEEGNARRGMSTGSLFRYVGVRLGEESQSRAWEGKEDRESVATRDGHFR
ncbi:hypothetical protein M0657_008202 [Pyricularia oryzae]|uniref:Uncharacterized protein n=1 Tax=Pyricularia oryzae TaxID=318829 RepID=A0A4P7N3K8_PYROR|nr:hypothetical protein M9X92_008153 [Pyricularia oryzae]KAI7917224.1 hypothetical protein M0657_008202 [Pyricularia oryzae]QBZ56933.1 hypothetical protein PoMZ_01851 [Pyricularia oryzae]